MTPIKGFVPPTPKACPTCCSALNPHVGARVDLQTNTLIIDDVAPQRISLTPAEATLMTLLLEPNVQSYERLITGQWGALPCGDELSVLRVLINRLRNKLRETPLSIYTHIERGYQLVRRPPP